MLEGKTHSPIFVGSRKFYPDPEHFLFFVFKTLFDDEFNPMQVLEGKTHYLEFFGNLLPVTKSGDQLSHKFYAFRENRLPFNVRVRDPNNDAVGKPTAWE